MKRFPVSHSKRRIRLRVSGSQRNDEEVPIKKLADRERIPPPKKHRS